MKTALILLLFITGASCSEQESQTSSDAPVVGASHEEPVFSYPETDADALAEAITSTSGITSFLLFSGDEVVSEHYTGNAARDRFTNIKSASKSLLNVLVYAALENGYIDNLDQPIETWLGDYYENIDDERKKSITVRHLITMSTGLQSTSFGNYGRWVVSPDWVAFVLNSELQHEPGSRMVYSTGDTHLLSAVLTRATGMNLRSFANQYLTGPTGIRIGGWDTDPKGFYFGGNNMAVTPGGLLAMGRLYLNGGTLNGQRILSQEWVDESFTKHFEQSSYNRRGHDYGYLWWHNTFGPHSAWFAWGYGGQYVFILPDFNAVAVFTGNPDQRDRGLNNRIFALMEDQIVPWLFHNSEQ